MSIPVDVGDLPRTLPDFGPGYLLTVSPEGRVKAVSVEPIVEGETMLVRGPGRGSLANVGGNPVLTLLYPPREASGFSLLVDGTGSVEGEDVRVSPSSAVLHRSPSAGDGS